MSDLDPTLNPTIATDGTGGDDTVGHSAEGIRRLVKRVGEAVAECNDATRRLTSLEGMPDREPAYPGRSYFTSDDDDTAGHNIHVRNRSDDDDDDTAGHSHCKP
jgi:hypothetical protein